MPLTMEYTETLTVTSCWCGIHVAIPDNLYAFATRSDKHGVYCPLGHQFFFTDTVEKQLAREREHLAQEQRQHRATRELLRAEERSHVATRGHLTRARTRVKNGVCPCCNRHFENVEAHVKRKHPDFDPAAAP